jgi:hypothetical protein
VASAWHCVRQVGLSLEGDPYWAGRFGELARSSGVGAGRLHVAVFVEPFLRFVLEGRKTVESRFSVRRSAPFGRVRPGDVVLLKRSGGPVVGVCEISDVWFYRLDPGTWSEIRREFSEALCAQDPGFWRARERASFATLMAIGHARRLRPVAFPKRDRRGWVIVGAEGRSMGLAVE